MQKELLRDKKCRRYDIITLKFGETDPA